MEKIPGFRVVGSASEEAKQLAKDKIETRLTDHYSTLSEKDLEVVNSLEPKSEEELAIIGVINNETNRLRELAGMPPYEIPPNNFHKVSDKIYKKVTGDLDSIGAMYFREQAILLRSSQLGQNIVPFASVALHEALHLKGHLTIEVSKIEDEKSRITSYREGVSALSAQNRNLKGEKHTHFDGLHEAIVSEQEKKSLPIILNQPVFDAERVRLNSESTNILKEIISSKNNLPEEDIFWVGNNEKEYVKIYYPKQRAVLNYVCDEIYKNFSDKYSSTDEVFNEFLKAHFTGQLLTIARLVEKTFGEGSFRTLGDMKPDRESAVLTLENLQKARGRFLRAQK